jgi:hypothetical protein
VLCSSNRSPLVRDMLWPVFLEENPKLSPVNEISHQPFQTPEKCHKNGCIAADG